ncbi:hypothetical protein K435DRAFT_784132, partial [Dendrothele bispora CBS 962.96]
TQLGRRLRRKRDRKLDCTSISPGARILELSRSWIMAVWDGYSLDGQSVAQGDLQTLHLASFVL